MEGQPNPDHIFMQTSTQVAKLIYGNIIAKCWLMPLQVGKNRQSSVLKTLRVTKSSKKWTRWVCKFSTKHQFLKRGLGQRALINETWQTKMINKLVKDHDKMLWWWNETRNLGESSPQIKLFSFCPRSPQRYPHNYFSENSFGTVSWKYEEDFTTSDVCHFLSPRTHPEH